MWWNVIECGGFTQRAPRIRRGRGVCVVIVPFRFLKQSNHKDHKENHKGHHSLIPLVYFTLLNGIINALWLIV